ncbi:MAG: Rv3717 family N-acetylmuramoyl-L-alanine amidase [Mycobacteriaceae bacterium]|nr:Rv3717 family N-acetylmuramoyl-L-alanine amidase [Mycobacteriaceae bacterium]MBV9515644.1 Rv3717 family N-acetylmuramoyl-L-alanine amidase [Mycobacteriaceae bacterium]
MSVSVPSVYAAPANIAGRIVFIDPGNDTATGQHVSDGRGGTADCQTAGTSTSDGYPEHSFTWEVALRIRSLLNQLGVRSALSRGNDDAAGPCVDQRATMANALHPDAVISIHGDSGPPSGRGFHVDYSAPPLNQAQTGPALQFARIMRDQLQAAGVAPANYIGQDGLYGRADLAELNLEQYPAILVDLGNMKNPADDALITTPDGRQKYAAAVVNGIAGFLAQTKVA